MNTAVLAAGAPAPGVYQSVNQCVLGAVPADVREVLDVGCGGGAFGAALKARTPAARVCGITHAAAEAAQARLRLDEVLVTDLDAFVDGDLAGRRFDAIVCSHVLEHLREPRRLLEQLVPLLANDGQVVVALPNVLHWRQRLQFLAGRFRYTEGGLMDRTHLRFFDWETAHALLADAGWQVLDRGAEGGLPLARLLGPWMARRLDAMAVDAWPGLFGHQFVLVARRPA